MGTSQARIFGLENPSWDHDGGPVEKDGALGKS